MDPGCAACRLNRLDGSMGRLDSGLSKVMGMLEALTKAQLQQEQQLRTLVCVCLRAK